MKQILHIAADFLKTAVAVIKGEGMFVAELIVEKGASILHAGRNFRTTPRSEGGSTETKPFSADD